MKQGVWVKLLLVVTAACFVSASAVAQTTMPIRVDRYDDADDYLPEMERKNTSGIRLFLRQQEGENLVKVLSPRNVTVDVIERIPEGADFGVVFLLGGTSVLSIQNEKLDRSFSFHSRSRDYWWEQKAATFLVDAPSDRLDKAGIEDARWRSGRDHQVDLKAVLDSIALRFKGPLVVHGHSNGALSVANIAALNHPAVRAFVYSSGSHYKRPTTIIYDTAHQAPVIFVQHKNDTCRVSATEVFEQFTERVKAPSKTVLVVDGGVAAMSGACGGFAPHSFVGMEREVINQQIPLIRQALAQ